MSTARRNILVLAGALAGVQVLRRMSSGRVQEAESAPCRWIMVARGPRGAQPYDRVEQQEWRQRGRRRSHVRETTAVTTPMTACPNSGAGQVLIGPCVVRGITCSCGSRASKLGAHTRSPKAAPRKDTAAPLRCGRLRSTSA